MTEAGAPNSIHPTALIGPGVELGIGNVIGPHAVLLGPLVLGDHNWIGPGVVLGTPSEIRGFQHLAGWEHPGQGAGVHIGDHNVFREHSVVHQGWRRPTVIASSCFLMNKTYVAHDGRLADGVTLAAGVNLAGHVRVGAGANLGLGAQVHQRRIIGPGSMIGMGSVVTRDIPPHAKAYGVPAQVRGINSFALERDRVPGPDQQWLERLYESGGEPGVTPGMADVPAALQISFRWWAQMLAES